MHQPFRQVWALTIHDHAQHRLSFDVGDIVSALELDSGAERWIVNLLDWEGEVDALDAAGLRSQATESEQLVNVVLKRGQLMELYQHVSQTLDGSFMAIPLPEPRQEDTAELGDWRTFRKTRAVAAIIAWDARFFVVLTKSSAHVEAIRERFEQVRMEDPDEFCD